MKGKNAERGLREKGKYQRWGWELVGGVFGRVWWARPWRSRGRWESSIWLESCPLMDG